MYPILVPAGTPSRIRKTRTYSPRLPGIARTRPRRRSRWRRCLAMLRSEVLPLLRSVGRSPRSPNYTGSAGLPPLPKSPHNFLRFPHTCTALYPSPSQAQQSLNITSCWPVFKDSFSQNSPKITVLLKTRARHGLGAHRGQHSGAHCRSEQPAPTWSCAGRAQVSARPGPGSLWRLCAPPPVVLGRGASEPAPTTGSRVGAQV